MTRMFTLSVAVQYSDKTAEGNQGDTNRKGRSQIMHFFADLIILFIKLLKDYSRKIPIANECFQQSS